jgi:hypothetical protein
MHCAGAILIRAAAEVARAIGIECGYGVADLIPYCDLSIIASAAIFAAHAFNELQRSTHCGGRHGAIALVST